ncbi:MAG: hypothetical protein HY591_00170, partial [Candidatus Omnitrophica bacterium]|nr:hypothetical protein [Candidatus Omnitrophota bacterium]
PSVRNFLLVDGDRAGDNPSTLQLWGPFSDGQKGKFQMVVRGNHPSATYKDAFDFSIFDGTAWKERMMRFTRDGKVAFMEGNVGIGIMNAQRKLVVQNDTQVDASTALALYNVDPNNNTDTVISFRGDTTGSGGAGFKELSAIQSKTITHNNNTAASSLSFWNMDGAGTLRNRIQIMPNGNVGISVADPQAKLHIGGTAGTDGIMFPDGTVQTTANTANRNSSNVACAGSASYCIVTATNVLYRVNNNAGTFIIAYPASGVQPSSNVACADSASYCIVTATNVLYRVNNNAGTVIAYPASGVQ